MCVYPPVPLPPKMKELGLSFFKMLHFPHKAKFFGFFFSSAITKTVKMIQWSHIMT